MISFDLSQEEKKTLVNIANKALFELFHFNKKSNSFQEMELTQNLKRNCGLFVSIYNQKELRACIGQFNPSIPLYKLVEKITVSAAKTDHRFKPIVLEELGELTLELSVLTPLEKITTIEQIEIGKHGIYIKNGYHSGTFLPQVATKYNWNIEEFLGNCSKNKAGLGWDGWKYAELYRYEAIIINSKDFS